MKKSFVIVVSLCLVACMAACSQRNSANSQSSSDVPSVSEPSSEMSQLSMDESSQSSADATSNTNPMDDGQYDSSALVASIQGIIQQYKDGTVDTETGAPGASAPDFDKKPEDLTFPDINSERDFQSVEPIKGHEKTLLIHIKCSGDYIMQIRVNTADNYKVTSTMFFV